MLTHASAYGAGPLGRIGHATGTGPPGTRDQQVRGDQRVAQPVVPAPQRAVRRRSGSRPSSRSRSAPYGPGSRSARSRITAVSGRPAAGPAGRRRRPAPSVSVSTLSPRRDLEARRPARRRAAPRAGTVARLLSFGRLVPGGAPRRRPPGPRPPARQPPVAGASTSHLAPLQVQEAGNDGTSGVVGALQQALGLADGRLGGVDVAVAGRHQHPELEPDLVLAAPSRGRGRAGTPRTGSRRRPAGRRARCSPDRALMASAASGGTAPAASVSSARSVASQVGRARRVLKRMQLIERVAAHP